MKNRPSVRSYLRDIGREHRFLIYTVCRVIIHVCYGQTFHLLEHRLENLYHVLLHLTVVHALPYLGDHAASIEPCQFEGIVRQPFCIVASASLLDDAVTLRCERAGFTPEIDAVFSHSDRDKTYKIAVAIPFIVFQSDRYQFARLRLPQALQFPYSGIAFVCPVGIAYPLMRRPVLRAWHTVPIPLRIPSLL